MNYYHYCEIAIHCKTKTDFGKWRKQPVMNSVNVKSSRMINVQMNIKLRVKCLCY